MFAKNEANILERDILKNATNYDYVYTLFKFYDLVRYMTEYEFNGSKLTPELTTEEVIEFNKKINNNNYKKYLVAELEEILNIMKEKGIHPQDLIKRIINKANRDIK